MSLKKRLLRILLTLVLVGAFAGYFAFSTFLFSPLEGGIQGDVATLVPRDVDFFVARAQLASTFEGFPRLRVVDRLEKHEAWRTLLSSPEYTQLDQEHGIAAGLAQAADAQDQVPFGIKLPAIFGGKDVAVAGYFRGPDLAQAEVAVYGHLNWLGKLGIELLEYPGLLGLSDQGLTVGVEKGYVSLSGGRLPREIYVMRVLDVGIVSTSLGLIQSVSELQKGGAQDSFGQSARYQDYIANANRSRERDDFELYFDMMKYTENLKLTKPWPDPSSQDFLQAFLGRFFQRGTIKEITGVLDVDEGVSFDFHGELSSEKVSPTQARFYRTRGFDRQQVLSEIGHLAPADTCLFLYLHGNAGDLLRETLGALDGETRKLIEEAMRCTGRYNSLQEMVQELEGTVRDRFAIIIRPNDYQPDPNGPPHDDTVVFAVSLVVWIKDEGEPRLIALRDAIGNRGDCFGLKGRTPGEVGYFKNYESGFETREFWNELIPGTGVVATLSTRKLAFVTNHFRMLGHLVKTQTQGSPDHPRLSDRPDFTALLNSSLAEANLLLWVNPKTAGETLRARARQVAQYEVESAIDWRVERAKAEDEVIRQSLPGKRRGRLTDEEQKQVDDLVAPILESLRARVYAEQVPAFMARHERWVKYSEAVQAGLFMLSLDPKSFEASLRLVVPLP